MLNEQAKIQQIIQLATEVAKIWDIDLLLEKILSAARAIVNADAGTIYIRRENMLEFSHTQNATLQKRLPAGKKLLYQTFSIPINHESIAGYVASTGETVNIADVYWMDTEHRPYAFDRSFDEKSHYQTQSMLTVPLENYRQEILGVLQLINSQNEDGETIAFFEHDIPLIKIFANHVVMALQRAQTIRSEILGLIRVLSEIRDPEETEAHVNRVGAYSAEIYEHWALTKGIPLVKIEKDVDMLRMAAMLHDLGKLAISHELREYPGKFTAKEYALMQQHTIKGAQMLLQSAQTPYENIAAEIALTHHEFWDGSGYPGHVDIETGLPLSGYENGNGGARGKKGAEIPVYGRIVAIADTYDALSSRRAFRDAMNERDVLNIMKRGAGTHFDPEMIDSFFQRLDTIRSIKHRFPET